MCQIRVCAAIALLVIGCGAGDLPVFGAKDGCLRMLDAWDAKLAGCQLRPADPAPEAARRAQCAKAVDLLLDVDACKRALDALPCEQLGRPARAPEACAVGAL